MEEFKSSLSFFFFFNSYVLISCNFRTVHFCSCFGISKKTTIYHCATLKVEMDKRSINLNDMVKVYFFFFPMCKVRE